MVAGHLREQNGYYQMILTWKDNQGKRKTKSISTGLVVKGNKKRAEAMLLKAREEFKPENLPENASITLAKQKSSKRTQRKPNPVVEPFRLFRHLSGY